MTKTYIYLDYNSSAPLRPDAWEVMQSILTLKNAAHNASSVHYFGRLGYKYIENARKQVASIVGADTNQVIFNSGATEGNNTLLLHFAKAYPDETILITDGQHPSIMEATSILNNVKTVQVDKNGLVKFDYLENMLRSETRVSLLSCLYANNESGVIQDVSRLSILAHKYGALFHCDAAQAAGKIPIDMKKSGIDFLTLSSHKIGGAQGAGALILGLCGQSPSLLFGGGQEKHLRSGTQNVAAIAGFGAAAEAAQINLDEYQKLEILRDKLESKLKEISPNIIIHCENAPRLANTSFFSIKDANAQNILIALDLNGIAISSGSACSSGSVKPSPALKAMGLPKEISSNALRISMGWSTKESDIYAFLCAFEKIIKRIESK